MSKLFLDKLRNSSVYAPQHPGTNFVHKAFTINILMALFVLFLISWKVEAQDTLEIPKFWQTGFNSNLNLAQLALANWTGGGQSSMSLNSRQTATLDHIKDRVSWSNTLDLAYGLQKLNGGGFRKSDDLIKFVSNLNYTFANTRWRWTTQFNFWSQFAPGFIYSEDQQQPDIEISRFMAPGYFQQALGLSYARDNHVKLSLLPLTGKVTVVVRPQLALRYGLEDGETIKTELGSSFNLNINKLVWENVQLLSDINLFSPYNNLSRIDVNGELQLKMKVNKYISTALAAQLIYDHDVDIDQEREGIQRDVQFKELLTIGLVYDWGAQK
jgi:hypothetical protein